MLRLSGLRATAPALCAFLVNNQIGFTTYRATAAPRPILRRRQDDRGADLHANGDDPEAVVFAAKIAPHSGRIPEAVVIDMFCYGGMATTRATSPCSPSR